MRLKNLSSRPPHYSNRHFFSKLLSALVLTVVVAFGLTLWQSGGALLSSDYKASSFPIPDSRFFNFSGLVQSAQAQSCTGTGDPTPPPSGSGAIYYNSCAGEFRMYTTDPLLGSRWERINLWKQSSDGSQLYLADPTLTQKVGIGTNNPTSWLHINAGSGLNYSNREPIQFTVTTGTITGTSSPNITAVIKSNVSEFGVWYDTGSIPTSRWADIITSKLEASQICLPNDDLPANCKTSWPSSLGGDGFWDSLDSTVVVELDTIKNINLKDSTIPSLGGDVKITHELYVDTAISITGDNAVSSGWIKEGNFPSFTDMNCATASQCSIKAASIKAIDSTNSFKIAVGGGGLVEYSTVGGTWARGAAYNTNFGTMTSVWAERSGNAYAVESDSEPRLLRWTTSGWQEVIPASSFYMKATNVIWGGGGYLYMGEDNRAFIHRYAINSDGSFNSIRTSCAGDSLDQIMGISGFSNGDFTAVALFSSTGKYADFITACSSKPREGTFQNSAGTAFDFVPQAVAVDYNGSASCSNCIIAVGRRAGSGTNKANVLLKDRTNAYWSPNELIVGSTPYNRDGVEFTSAWIGLRGSENTIILSGVDGSQKIILTSTTNGVSWSLDLPTACTGTCENYVVLGVYESGGLDTQYVIQRTDRIFRKGVTNPAGSLYVNANIDAPYNTWGAEEVRSGLPSAGVSCNQGYYVVKYRVVGSEVELTCRKL